MAGMATLATATSGLRAAQAGLYVTGHNMSNVETKGYSRQSALQQDTGITNIGFGSNGLMQVGLGTDIAQIRQIRDIFLDRNYRTEASIGSFYSTKYNVGAEIETILGELQSQYKTQTVMQDLWDSLNELSIHPEGLETRGNFISTAITFLDKIKTVSDGLYKEQIDLDNEVRSSVVRINQLTTEIEKYNRLIVSSEVSGEHANDFRDARNVCIDELSEFMDISYKENSKGSIDIMVDGNELVVNGVVNKMGLRYTSSEYSFVEPVFTKSPEILPFDPTGKNARSVYRLEGSVNSLNKNDKGKLKALLVTRGIHPANYSTEPNPTNYPPLNENDPQYKKELFNVKQSTIPKIQKELDTLIHDIITSINDAVSPLLGTPPTQSKDPNAPVGLDGTQHLEIFVRKNMDRFTGNDFNAEDPTDIYSLYSMSNVTINPLLLDPDGFDKIALSPTGDVGNAKVVNDIMTRWKSKTVSLDGSEPSRIDDFYANFIVGIAVETEESRNFLEEQTKLILKTDNDRKQLSGVSLDEEMKNMMIYQHAYNASARVVNQIDSMLDRIINNTGRVGR